MYNTIKDRERQCTLKLVRIASFEEWAEIIEFGRIYGQYGEVQYSDDGESIICPLCGQEFGMLTHKHLKAHGLTCGDDLRELMGFRRNQPLSSLSHHQIMREHSIINDNASHIRGDRRYAFTAGYDARRHLQVRYQTNLDRSDQVLRRRAENRPIAGWGTRLPNERVIRPSGRFTLFGQTYYFGMRYKYQEVTFQLRDDVIIAWLTSDSRIQKQYRRKDI